jgi:hypothetical protein
MGNEVLDVKFRTFKLNERLSKLKESTKSTVQSLLFSKGKFTENAAKTWAKEHGYSDSETSVTDSFIHMTQRPAGKFKDFKTVVLGEGIQARMAGNFTSKFVGHLFLTQVSKFSASIASDLDMPMPFTGEIRFLCEGPNRDGVISRDDLENSLSRWTDVPIIDWHDMADMSHPTGHKISDRKGYLGNPHTQMIDGKTWVVAPVEILDRTFAYHLYRRAQAGKPLEVSPEYGYSPYWINGQKFQGNIQPHLISVVDRGHIKGNSITFPVN